VVRGTHRVAALGPRDVVLVALGEGQQAVQERRVPLRRAVALAVLVVLAAVEGLDGLLVVQARDKVHSLVGAQREGHRRQLLGLGGWLRRGGVVAVLKSQEAKETREKST